MMHEYSVGSAFLLPNGVKIWRSLEEYFRAEYKKRGYKEVITPIIASHKLFEQSGHLANYQENMFGVVPCHDLDKNIELKENDNNEDQNTLSGIGIGKFSMYTCPMNCISGDAHITLTNNTSILMNNMQYNDIKIVGFSSKTNNTIETTQSHFLNNGEKSCIDIMFSNGNVLTCTPDHLIRTKDKWKMAKDINLFDDKILGSITYPVLSYIPCNWKLEIQTNKSTTIFTLDTIENYKRTMAFSRLCGLIITDGNISKQKARKDVYQGEFYAGHELDAQNIVDDINLILDTEYKCNSKFYETKNTWRINMSTSLARIFAYLFGHGNRLTRNTIFPDFITNKDTPLEIKKQFLSGIFGGDGWTPLLSKGSFTEPYISWSKTQDFLPNLKTSIEIIADLLEQCGIQTKINGPYKNDRGKGFSYRLKILTSSIENFDKHIGFAYCCHKTHKFSIVASYNRLKSYYQQKIKELCEMFGFLVGDNLYTNSSEHVYTQLCKQFIKNNNILNDTYIKLPALRSVASALKNNKYVLLKGGINFISALDYLKLTNSLHMFSNTYAVSRHLSGFPLFEFYAVKKTNSNTKLVYDISVDNEVQSFIANGIIVHNCPKHCLIYRNQLRSYRELPLRLADFCCLHRNEASGALRGLSRLKKFSQDDAHIFCTTDQIQEEIVSCMQFLKDTYALFGFEYRVTLSTRPDKFMGNIDVWMEAEGKLISAIESLNLPYTIKDKDGAFYGPKIDIMIKDALGREVQCGTIQLDFQLPHNFNLEYKDWDGQFSRPVMIHRAICGSIERMMSILIEHFQGKFPLWLSPRQVAIVPVSHKQEFLDYCNKLKQFLEQYDSRLDSINIFDSHDTMNYKLRDAELKL
jgi:hypothetical protein